MSDELVLGGASQLLRPDAVDNFGASNSEESSVRAYVQGRAHKPAGEEGEVVMRRLHVTGYHRSNVRIYVTPIVDRKLRWELRTYLSKSGSSDGREERFSFIVPLTYEHPDFPGILVGLRGTLFEVLVELRDPSAQVFLESTVYAHEPITPLRGYKPEE